MNACATLNVWNSPLDDMPGHRQDTGHPIRLSEQTVARLEALRQQGAKASVVDVIEEAIEVYARLRSARDMAAYERLTPRLRQVLRLITEGRSTKEMANRLHVGLKTVEFHRAQLMKRLGIDSVAGLARFAIRAGAILP